jgi:hypothetical protein
MYRANRENKIEFANSPQLNLVGKHSLCSIVIGFSLCNLHVPHDLQEIEQHTFLPRAKHGLSRLRASQPRSLTSVADSSHQNSITRTNQINRITKKMSFEPKTKVELDPPKDDIISLDYLSKCDGELALTRSALTFCLTLR